MACREKWPIGRIRKVGLLNIDAQDAQDLQDESFLQEEPALAMIRCGIADSRP